MRRVAVLVLLIASLLGTACESDETFFVFHISPRYVQGAYPGVPVSILVQATSTSDEPVTVTASVTKGTVRVSPSQLRPGDVGMVTFTGAPVPPTEEETVRLSIHATRGKTSWSGSRSIIVMPGSDDREAEARRVLGLFLPVLERERPELGLAATDVGTLAGRIVAPRLLIVDHYLFWNPQWELGLSWHIMIAPDDFSELYLRPRGELHPTRAFRIGSWSTALAGQPYEVVEVTPPAEVVR